MSRPSVSDGDGSHLVRIHDHLRAELDQVRDLVEQVAAGQLDAGQARSSINTMTMRQNHWTLGAYCASYCRILSTHHAIEDASMFPRLRALEPGLGPVLDRLERDHHAVAGILEDVDRGLVAVVSEPSRLDELRTAIDQLADTLLTHLSYEEQMLVEPLDRYGFF